jgi:hypothetical protein
MACDIQPLGSTPLTSQVIKSDYTNAALGTVSLSDEILDGNGAAARLGGVNLPDDILVGTVQDCGEYIPATCVNAAASYYLDVNNTSPHPVWSCSSCGMYGGPSWEDTCVDGSCSGGWGQWTTRIAGQAAIMFDGSSGYYLARVSCWEGSSGNPYAYLLTEWEGYKYTGTTPLGTYSFAYTSCGGSGNDQIATLNVVACPS